jgi:hypothetical protein
VSQLEALENQFQGMSDIPFSYNDYLTAKQELLLLVRQNLTQTDKEFLLSVEMGSPRWELCCAGDLSIYPSVQWKLLNIAKLKTSNPENLQHFLSL